MNQSPFQNSNLPETIPVMAHLVLGYPTLSQSLETAAQYVAAGIEILELQIPFSHPTADGPVITQACQEATKLGITIQDCIGALEQLRQQFPEQKIMVMSYLNRIYSFGFQPFIAVLERLNIQHLIVPDLPADMEPLFFPPDSRVKLVPVLAANTSEARLSKLLDAGFDFFYLMSDFKITGGEFSLHPNLKGLIARIKSFARNGSPAPKIGIGFGISTPKQAQLVAQEADFAIIGSALIQAQKTGTLESYLHALQQAFGATIIEKSC